MTRLSRGKIATLGAGTAILALLPANHALAAPQLATIAALATADEAAADDDAASADTSGSAGGAIVVTARRREEFAQDVPIALTVLSSQTLERTGAYTIDQIQRLAPSLQVIALNPRNSNINIRGLGSNSSVASDGLEPGFGFYVDGVYYARPGQSQFDLVDLERLEVLKGPQGTLFGKNTAAGAINVTTKAPSFTPEATVEASIGNYKYHQIRASASLPVVADKIAVRLTVADTHRDGYLRNIFNGDRYQDYDSFTVRGQLLIKPTETLSIRLIGDYSNQKQHSISVAQGYFSTYANGATIPNNIFDRAARNGYTLLPGDLSARLVDLDAPVQHFQKSYGVSGAVDWDFGAATLTSITAYRWWDWYPVNDIDSTRLAVQEADQDNFQRQFSQELRIASNGTNTIDYVAGLYYFWQKNPGYGSTRYGPLWAAWNLPSTTPAATRAIYDLALNGFEANFFANPQTKSYAAFGQVDWHIAEPLTLTAGLRYTHDDKKGEFRQVWVSGIDIATLPEAQRATATAARAPSALLSFSSAVRDSAVSGLVTLSYKPTDNILVYGSYSHGGKSGGLNLTSGGAFRPVIKPEKVDSFEIGLKSQFFDRKVTFNTAIFNTEVRDYQAIILEYIGVTTSTRSYISNVPKVRSRGVEADLTFAPSEWVNFTASAAYTDAKYIDYPNGQQATERLNISPIQDLSGTRVPGIPKFAYNLGLDVAQPVNALGSLEVYGRADYARRSATNTANNSIYGAIPSYGLLNLRIGLRTEDGRLDLSAWARNATDEDYIVNRGAGNFGVNTALLGDPRTFGLTLRSKW